jgi:hypothetical protein
VECWRYSIADLGLWIADFYYDLLSDFICCNPKSEIKNPKFPGSNTPLLQRAIISLPKRLKIPN